MVVVCLALASHLSCYYTQSPNCSLYYLIASVELNLLCQMVNFQIKHCKKFHWTLSKISLHCQTVIDQRQRVFHQLFSWISVGLSKGPIEKTSVSKAIRMSEGFPEYHVYCLRTLSQKFFSKWINFSIRHCKKFYCPLRKISVHYQTLIDQRLPVFYQLFRWTSVGPSKCLINKMIGSQDNLTVWAVPWIPYLLAENFFTDIFLQMNKFLN